MVRLTSQMIIKHSSTFDLESVTLLSLANLGIGAVDPVINRFVPGTPHSPAHGVFLNIQAYLLKLLPKSECCFAVWME